MLKAHYHIIAMGEMWKLNYSRIAALLLIITLTSSSLTLCARGQAGAVVLNPTDDAHTDGNYPNANHGSESILKAGGFHDAWLKFDLSSVPELAIGITATLELYTTWDGVPEPWGVVVDSVSSGGNFWSEDTITSANAPFEHVDGELDTDYVASNSTWYEWAVTEAVENATAQSVSEVTFLLRQPWGLITPHRTFNSKEAGKRIPKLTVSWEDIIPEFPSFTVLPILMLAAIAVTVAYKKLNG